MSKRASLLIVDDEIGPAESLRMIFKSRYEVTVAGDGESALRILRSRPIDAITLDLQMPSMSGIELLRAFRAADPRVEIVLITGYTASAEVIREAATNGAEYICKPFDVAHVREVVERAVARRHRDAQPSVPSWLAGFAHDIRTPIGAIIGYGEILADELDGQLDEHQRTALQRIQANAAALLQMVDSACASQRSKNGVAIANSSTVETTSTLGPQPDAEIDATHDASIRPNHIHRLP